MLRTLLTPLRARFDTSPRLPPQNTPEIHQDELTLEDFARDVLVELMRNSVEELKQAESFDDRMKVCMSLGLMIHSFHLAVSQILAEIHRIMNQNSYTKDVFREMDGFLGLYNVLSMLRTSDSSNREEENKKLHRVRLVLEIMSDATFEHDENARFFKVCPLKQR